MVAQLILRPRVVLLEGDARRARRIANLLAPVAELSIAYHLDEAVADFDSERGAVLVCPGSAAAEARARLPLAKIVTHSGDSGAGDDHLNLSVPGASQLASAVMRLFRRVPT